MWDEQYPKSIHYLSSSVCQTMWSRSWCWENTAFEVKCAATENKYKCAWRAPTSSITFVPAVCWVWPFLTKEEPQSIKRHSKLCFPFGNFFLTSVFTFSFPGSRNPFGVNWSEDSCACSPWSGGTMWVSVPGVAAITVHVWWSLL